MIRFYSADENSATQMAPVMASLRELATAGASVVVLHHKPKSETSSYRGSSDIVAGADAAFSLAKHDGLLELRTIKNRFGVEATVKIHPNFAAETCSPSIATAGARLGSKSAIGDYPNYHPDRHRTRSSRNAAFNVVVRSSCSTVTTAGNGTCRKGPIAHCVISQTNGSDGESCRIFMEPARRCFRK